MSQNVKTFLIFSLLLSYREREKRKSVEHFGTVLKELLSLLIKYNQLQDFLSFDLKKIIFEVFENHCIT